MNNRIWICIFCAISAFSSYGQIGNKGVPNIQNFSYEQYQASAQNWSIIQDDKGNMLFGNNYGLLEYNGKNWHLIIQPINKTNVRSLHKNKEGVVFIGAQNEIGYMQVNDAGQKRFISLLPKIPKQFRQFGDVWGIIETSEGIHFHTADAIYRYLDDTIFVLKTQPLNGYSKVGDSILVQNEKLDILVVKTDGLHKILDGKDVQNFLLKIYDDQHGGLQLISDQKGIRLFKDGVFTTINNSTGEFLKNHKIHSLHKLRNNYIAIGTVSAGLLIVDDNFNPIQWLNHNNGLQSNTILTMGTDHIGNLWVATEGGIDYVEIANPLYKIADYFHLEGTVSSTLIQGNQIYVGTNSGVFYSQWNAKENPLEPTLDFKPIVGITGQIWNLYKIKNIVYICAHDGFYRIENNRAIQILHGIGAWNLTPIKSDSSYFIQGTYNGIHLYQMQNNKLDYLSKIDGFDETSRIIEIDYRGNIWMAHGYKGIYKLKLDPDLKIFNETRLYVQEDGFPSRLFINLFKIKNKILFGTEWGTYQYDYEKDSMRANPIFMDILGKKDHIRVLKEDHGNVWYIKGYDMNDDIGIIEFYDNEKYELNKAPLQHLRGKFNPGFENFNILDPKTVLFGTKNGLALLDRSTNRQYNKSFEVNLIEVKSIIFDSLMYGQLSVDDQSIIQPKLGAIRLPFKDNSLRISYASNYFESSEQTKYSCYLEGFDRGWHEWETEQVKTYTNLFPGTYTFHYKALNIYGIESKEGTYTFIVLSPWYFNTYARIIYIIVISVFLYFLFKAYRRRIARAHEQERSAQAEVLQKNKTKYQQEKLITEQELFKLRNDKLESEIEIARAKMDVLNAEMAASIMMITQKNGVLIKVSEDLNLLLKTAKDSNRNLIENVIKHIDQDINTEQDWHQFKIHFDKVHEDFLERLKTHYSEITPKDLQLAAYLRLNLSSKEIASMMNITVRSVEGCRYRLRKHINLDASVNLSEFILKF